jgi:hypothetical protein
MRRREFIVAFGAAAEAAAGFQSRRERCREPTPVAPLNMLLSRHTRRREFIALAGGAPFGRPLREGSSELLA